MEKKELNKDDYEFISCTEADCDNGNACSMCWFGHPDNNNKFCGEFDCRGGYFIKK